MCRVGLVAPSRIRRASTVRLLLAEDGIAMIEFAVVIPVFLLIVLNIISFGPFLNVYLTTAHLSHEGVRMLSNQAELTQDIRFATVWQFDGSAEDVPCFQDQTGAGVFPGCGSVAGIPASHQDVHERIFTLIQALRLGNVFTNNEVGVISNYNFADDNVTFTIYGRYRGYAGFLLGNVVVTEEGPYLF